jgi:plasmid replication initiation protein
MKITNKEVIQSYLITAARYDFNVHQKRIIYRIVEMCQSQLEGQTLGKNFKIDRTLFGDYQVSMPIAAFLADELDENYTRVKAALKDLRNKTIEYDDNKIWKLIGIIEKPVLEKKGIVHFELQPEIYDAILNFAKGYRKYELKTAFSFETVYAMRFYELFSGKKDTITYSIDALKIMFKLEGKYTETKDFIRRVIDPAKKELDEKSPFSFTYEKQTQGKKVVALTFVPHEIKINKDPDAAQTELNRQLSVGWLDKIYIDYLEQNYMFDRQEIKNNLTLLLEASKKLDLLKFLSLKKRAASDKKNPKGWIISALKKELLK